MVEEHVRQVRVDLDSVLAEDSNATLNHQAVRDFD